MQDPTPPIRDLIDEPAFRARAAVSLHAAPPQTLIDPRTGRPIGPGDLDLNPDLIRIQQFAPEPRDAAVLVGVVKRPELTVLFTKRTETLAKHAGQISFPGGTIDADDKDAIGAALREADEEIGLKAGHIEPLGFLDAFWTGTGFRITPVVALIEPPFTLTLNRNEVDDAFEVPLDFLMNPRNHQVHPREFRGMKLTFHAIPYGPHYIWGATAGIVKNMHERLFRE
jgi:8-oxo-dGTP pyrophosphatase MutT (NUDIX family)